MRLLPAIIIAVALLIAPVLWIVLPKAFSGRPQILGPDADMRSIVIAIEDIILENMDRENTVFELQDSVEALNDSIQKLNMRVQKLEAELAQAIMFGGRTSSGQGGSRAPIGEMSASDYTQVVEWIDRTAFNKPLTVASPRFLSDLLGPPRQVLTDDCQPMQNPDLNSKLRVEQVGPIRVQMLEPAIESLRRVFAEVEKVDPKLHDMIQTAGSLCVRRIRGSTSVSTHSFGLSVDLKIGDRLDAFTDGTTQLGLTIMADFFHEEGWIWGAGFRREDSMHFEVSKEKVLEWREAGLL
ncbi:M15 family metallopeptidase [Aliiruegeria lutimaris]|uniref:D-alanyl-D-alanine carboxypeptidase n=1 Tax=Aliiruegeria lutimaris TaxID=571298 RepID=A0A1G8K7G1_9RHOB|nr:M15 family metallopeptidase [Aliiruegeria lutimaris]SDI39364.1 D-alanyl-D-alanine carboxypeptidase [Aliiruegeria lutimaris]